MPEFGSFDPQGRGFAQTLGVMGETQSMMQRAEAAKRAQAQFEYNQIQQELNAPLVAAQREADLSKALSERAMQENTQKARAQMYPMLANMQQDLDGVMSLQDDEQRANHALELLKRYSSMGLVPELKPISDQINHIATSIITDYGKTSALGNTLREIERMKNAGLVSPEEAAAARSVALGTQAKATQPKRVLREIKRNDGSIVLASVDPETGEFDIIGQQNVPGVSSTQPGPALVSQTAEQRAEAKIKEALSKDFPKRRDNILESQDNINNFIKDIDDLIESTSSNTTGIAGVGLSKIPGSPAYNYAAKLESLKSRIGFQTLAALRRSSPTGGALGNISNKENDLLQSTLGALKQGMSESELKKSLKEIRDRSIRQFERNRSSFLQDYPDQNLESQGAKPISEMTDEELAKEIESMGATEAK
jgi:hypothetical protein